MPAGVYKFFVKALDIPQCREYNISSRGARVLKLRISPSKFAFVKGDGLYESQ